MKENFKKPVYSMLNRIVLRPYALSNYVFI